MKQFFFFCIITLIKTVSGYAQPDTAFLKYLSQNNLKSEYHTYLTTLSKSSMADTINYYWTKFNLKYSRTEELLSSTRLCNSLLGSDTNLFNLTSIYFLNKNLDYQTNFFSNSGIICPDAFVANNVRQTFNMSLNPKLIDTTFLPEPTRASFKNFVSANRKKPLLSGLLSAVFPGSGKLYIGRPRSFINVLFLHLLNGIAVYETTKKLGVKNPYTIVCLSYSGLFYLANIYGSYHETKQMKKEKRKQFLSDVSDYYKHNYSSRFTD